MKGGCCFVISAFASDFTFMSTEATNHLNPIIISKAVFGVNGKEDEKLMRGEMFRNAELILKM